MSAERDRLTRRDFLKIAGISGLSIAVLAYGLDKTLFNEEISQILEDSILEAVKFRPQEFENTSSLEGCRNIGRVFVIGHKGYLKNLGYNETDYQTYYRNIVQLGKYLFLSGEPTFMVIEDRVFQQGNTASSICTNFIVTRNSEGTLKRYVHTENGIKYQDMNRSFNLLKNSGIKTACLAGEQAWYGTQGEIGTGACLWQIANSFAESNFNIKGVHGCIYPPNPPNRPNKVLKEIYTDTIQIPEISP